MEVTYPKTTTENCKTIGEKAMLQVQQSLAVLLINR